MTISANLEGSETLDATSLDNPANWDFYDPDEEQASGESQDKGTESDADDEADAVDDTAEDESDAEPNQADDEDSADEDPDGQPEDDKSKAEADNFTLPTGEKVSRDELIAGYMKQADYSRKTSQVAESRRQVEQQAQRLQRQFEVLTDYLAQSIPDEPPLSLLQSDPNAYLYQKEMHAIQIKNLTDLLARADEPKSIASEINDQHMREFLDAENSKLEAAFPYIKDQSRRKEFFETSANAAKKLGFSDEEIKGAVDSRMFVLAHWAHKGMLAEAAKAKAKQKVVNAPKAAPPTQRRSSTSDAAMKRLEKSGSIDDAILIDFE